MDKPNADVAAELAEIAALLRAQRADRFRVRAYEQVARVLQALPVPFQELEPGELRGLTGIGPSLQAVLAERAATGRIRLLERLRSGEPPGFGRLVGLPLIGVRAARTLAAEHGVHDLAALQELAADEERMAALGEPLAAKVREALRRAPAGRDPRLPLPAARSEATALAAALRQLPGVSEVAIAGALRRGLDLVPGFDLVVVLTGQDSEDPQAALAAVLADASPRMPRIGGHERDGARPIEVIAPSGHAAVLHPCRPATRGAMLLHATGPAAHLARLAEHARSQGLQLRRDSLWRDASRLAGADEDELYRKLGLAPIPPELRDDDAVLEAAAAGRVPVLVRAGDLRGDLHAHSDFSGDGQDSLLEMVRGAAGRGYDYLALTDHAENLTINGMTREAVLARRRTIAQVQQRHPHVRILDAAELNIGRDGALDYDLDFLLQFDFTVASVHSDMHLPAAEQTERILAAIASPAVNVIGHPTGRILRHRPGYEIDLTAIAQAAAETGTALEVNGSPERLDLDAAMARAAVRAGAPLALTSDAHSVIELAYILDAVPLARHAGAQIADVINAWSLDELLAAVARKRNR